MTITPSLQRRRRILIFSGEPLTSGYGSATALRTFTDAVLRHTDWELVLVVPREKCAGQWRPDTRLRQIAIHPSPTASRRLRLVAYAAGAAVGALAGVLPRPDVVISWQPLPAALPGSLLARAHRVPHVVRTCGPELSSSWSRYPRTTSLLRPCTHLLLARADAVVVKSELERSLLAAQVPRDRIHLVPNAVNERYFDAAIPTHDRPPRFLSVCQLERHKNPEVLVEAFGGMARTGVCCGGLTVVGAGALRDTLLTRVTRSGADVELPGRVAGANMPEVYARHDVFVLASHMEGCSNAALEAMASGLPVIGTRTAVSDLVEDGSNGLLLDTPDPAALGGALVRFLALPRQQRIRMSRAARARARHHAPRRLVRHYAELLDSLW
ncbi:glycosyltransferase family 4 protein [Streptomyces sp. NPDC096176]|uniref:glycosyltransferase family 4 protein n=1 Tax=Streptomyces sp. NPDC096176 TaxID=3366079 RepID=UPI0038212BF8